ncbi:DUF484 family protein [Marinomonas agarivorans]|nr:DUF484 family protein [Marinomonas agarivorans]
MQEKDVITFLQQNPDFFQHHSELLETLHVPHPHQAEKVVSLIEKQVALLRQSTDDYKKQFQGLVKSARESNLVVQRSKKIVAASMHCASLDDFSIMLDDVLRKDFQIDHHSLLLFSDNQLDTNVLVSPLKEAMSLLGERLTNQGQFYDALSYRQARFLFPHGVDSAQSFITLPLSYCYQGKSYYLGVLTLASDKENYFQKNKTVLSLDYFAELLSIILIRLML